MKYVTIEGVECDHGRISVSIGFVFDFRFLEVLCDWLGWLVGHELKVVVGIVNETLLTSKMLWGVTVIWTMR